MNTLTSFEKQQVGLRVPKYLFDEMDEFSKTFSVNRSDSNIEIQKENIFYDEFETSVKELKTSFSANKKEDTLEDLINEIESL